MPWRNTKDPYFIWISEIILQQTRVNQGTPYYLKFVETFPTVKDLADADERDVLRLWQGLGYYSRARNLHAGAKMVISEFEGKVPANFKDLLKIKGIGRYTAAAISSIVSKEAVAVVDGNVYRVLSRVFGIDTDILSSAGQNIFFDLANKIISQKEPDLHNQGLMEFGSLHCTPQNPDCDTCVFVGSCYAFKNNEQKNLPVKIKKTKIKKRYFHYLVMRDKDRLIMKERKGKGIWQGLFDFHLVEGDEFLSLEDITKEGGIPSGSTIDQNSYEQKHLLSHQEIHARFYEINLPNAESFLLKEDKTSYSIDEIENLPKPILIDNYLKTQGYYE